MLGDTARIHNKAQQHLAKGQPEQAEALYRQLLGQTHVIDLEYNQWLEGAAQTFRALGRDREAGFVYLNLGRLDRAADLFPRDRQPEGAARVLELRARPLLKGQPERAGALLREAAGLYAAAGRHVLAAIAASDAGDRPAALLRWERVLADPRLRGRSYERGLVHFNMGLLHLRAGEQAESHTHLVQAQQILEDLADDFEARGERERAFDCYAVLLQLGKELQSFENLAEGYINCIRVLKEDNLKFYVLQYYEDFLRLALEQKEFHAAATMFREAADYTRRVGLIYDREYLRRAGAAWGKAAEKNEQQGGPVKMSENALLAAVDSYNAISDFARVRETYQRLSALGLGEKRQTRYQKLAQRFAQGLLPTQPEAPSFPEYLRHQHAYPDIWFLDMIEWEYDGDPGAVCAAILGDPRHADMVRRRALYVLLLQLAGGGGAAGGSSAAATTRELSRVRLLEQIAQGLGEMQTYASLRPLERLYEDRDPRVRRAAMAALRYLTFKRTYQLVMRGLRDEDAAVREAALSVMRELHFPHAVDPLTRIFREHEAHEVKRAALESLGRVGDLSAGEFLISVVRHETDALRLVARQQLLSYDNPDILPIIKRYHEMETGRARELLEGVLRGR